MTVHQDWVRCETLEPRAEPGTARALSIGATQQGGTTEQANQATT